MNKLECIEVLNIFKNNDLIFFTETWSNKFTNMDVNGFKLIALHRTDKKIGSKRDSGGIACYIRNNLLKYIDFYNSDSDDILWLKCKGNLFDIENDVYMCLLYVLPTGSSREALIQTNIFDRVLIEMAKINTLT